MTVGSIIRIVQAGHPFCVEDEIGENKIWICPKYDGNDFDEDILKAFMRITLSKTLEIDDLKKLGYNDKS